MTLFRQIALMLALFLALLLGTILILNFQSANKAVQEQLYEDAKNTASSLGLSLATAKGDISTIETMINATFDSGHFASISFSDMQGKVLYDRIVEEVQDDVPAWFKHLVSIKAPIASANVSSGWNPIGMLSVQSDNSYAYVQLYSTFKNLLISFTLLAVIGLSILYLLLHIVLKPLKTVRAQAEAILHNRFITQKEIPHTLEFRDVVLGMNNMVVKVEEIFKNGNEALQRNHELLYSDPITKLHNRRYLMLKFPEHLLVDSSHHQGALMFISLEGALEANQILGRQKVDRLYFDIAQMMQKVCQYVEDAILARVNGTEFSILLPGATQKNAEAIAKEMILKTKELMHTAGLKQENCELEYYGLNIGLYLYDHRQKLGDILANADYALSQAKISNEHFYIHTTEAEKESMGKGQWREILEEALVHKRFALTPWVVMDSKKRQIHHNVLTISFEDAKKHFYSYGKFIGPAIALGFAPRIYHTVLEILFTQTPKELVGGTHAVRLPSEYLHDASSFNELAQLCQDFADKLPFSLIIEFPDKLMYQNSSLIQTYKRLLERHKIDLAIHQFTGTSKDFSYLKELRPKYIKADIGFFLDQTKESMDALQIVTNALGIILVATGVEDDLDLKELHHYNITVVQGKITELL